MVTLMQKFSIWFLNLAQTCLICTTFQFSLAAQEPRDYKSPSNWEQVQVAGVPIKIAYQRTVNYRDKDKRAIEGPLRSKPFRDLFVLVTDTHWSIALIRTLCQEIASQKNEPARLNLTLSNSEELLLTYIDISLMPWKIQQDSNTRLARYLRDETSVRFIYYENGNEVLREEVKLSKPLK